MKTLATLFLFALAATSAQADSNLARAKRQLNSFVGTNAAGTDANEQPCRVRITRAGNTISVSASGAIIEIPANLRRNTATRALVLSRVVDLKAIAFTETIEGVESGAVIAYEDGKVYSVMLSTGEPPVIYCTVN